MSLFRAETGEILFFFIFASYAKLINLCMHLRPKGRRCIQKLFARSLLVISVELPIQQLIMQPAVFSLGLPLHGIPEPLLPLALCKEIKPDTHSRNMYHRKHTVILEFQAGSKSLSKALIFCWEKKESGCYRGVQILLLLKVFFVARQHLVLQMCYLVFFSLPLPKNSMV